MRLSRRWIGDDTGSASLEFITAGVLLLVPLAYLVVGLTLLQGATFAAEGAARHAARVFVQASSVREGEMAAERATRFAFADYGIEEGIVPLRYSCSPDPQVCLTRGGRVTVTVRVIVPLPLIPSFVEPSAGVGIPLEARATQAVSRFWGSEPPP